MGSETCQEERLGLGIPGPAGSQSQGAEHPRKALLASACWTLTTYYEAGASMVFFTP